MHVNLLSNGGITVQDEQESIYWHAATKLIVYHLNSLTNHKKITINIYSVKFKLTVP
jgi:hypothetical protein